MDLTSKGTLLHRDHQRRLLLVVVENDVTVPSSEAAARPEDEPLLVTQAAGELPVSLALRVAEIVTAVECSNRRLARAFLVMGSAAGEQISRARQLIARLVVSHMVFHGSGELVLAAEEGTEALREELVELADALLAEHAPSRVAIRLVFGDGAASQRPSEIRALGGARPVRMTRR